jgi:hypothetical protein
VAWSISPDSGTITLTSVNGQPTVIYQAPAVVTSTQTVYLKATSLQDPTKFGNAAITLFPTLQPPDEVFGSIGNGGALVEWSQVTGATGYRVYGSTDALVSPHNATIVDSGLGEDFVSNLTNGVTYYFTVTSVDGNFESAASQSIQITPEPLVVIQSADLPTAVVGQPYSFKLDASGFHPPFQWGYADGPQLPGVIVSTDGFVTGTPLSVGTFPFNAIAFDSDLSAFATKGFSLTIAPSGVALTLPTPVLALASQIPVDATITANDPSGLATQFHWLFTPEGGSGTAVPALTGTPNLDLSTLLLKPGNYVITLYTSAGSVMSPIASKLVALVLPPPVLKLDSTWPINADIILGIPPGISFTRYEWSISQAQPNAAGISAAPSVIARSVGSAAFRTQLPKANAAVQGLGTGYYSVSVTAYDSDGNPSMPAQAFTTFLATDLNGVKIHPSPWRSDLHSGHPITFDGLPANSTIKIFTVSGRWVKTISNANGLATWDVKNDSGDMVASGLYIYLVTDDQGNKTHGKFAVIR